MNIYKITKTEKPFEISFPFTSPFLVTHFRTLLGHFNFWSPSKSCIYNTTRSVQLRHESHRNTGLKDKTKNEDSSGLDCDLLTRVEYVPKSKIQTYNKNFVTPIITRWQNCTRLTHKVLVSRRHTFVRTSFLLVSIVLMLLTVYVSPCSGVLEPYTKYLKLSFVEVFCGH